MEFYTKAFFVALAAVVAYGTVAYLAARLQRRRWARWLTLFIAACVIALISFSRLYLGVHYPSDVAGGLIVGTAWVVLCTTAIRIVDSAQAARERLVE